jgi:hypothetical protein
LAAHYGLDTAEEEKDDFVEVSLADLPRRGVLTHAGILAANAHPNATSPTRRGMWVLQQLLCTTTPEPPADVDTELDPPGENETRRQQLDRHRQDPACAGCHSLTDPLGLAFETYDAIGAWRDQENGIAIDPSGELPGGVQFRDAIELSTLLAEDPRYAPCVARKVLSYALGRRAQSSDNAFIDEVLATAEAKDGALASVIEAFIQTPPFHTHPGHTEEGN